MALRFVGSFDRPGPPAIATVAIVSLVASFLTSAPLGASAVSPSPTAVSPSDTATQSSSDEGGDTSADAVADDYASARANAAGTGHRVEILSERTETTQLFVDPDGTLTRPEAAAPVRVRDDTGPDGWRDIDLTLVSTAGGGIVPVSPYVPTTISAGDDAELVSVGVDDGEVALSYGAPLPVPTLSGDTATYADVEPGIDLQVKATRFGAEQFFVIKERPVDDVVLSLDVSSEDLTLEDPDAADDSGMVVLDTSGDVAATISPATSWDASAGVSGADFVVSDMTLSEDGDSIAITPDPDWLSDPETKYPVVIDPSITVSGSAATSDTFVRSDFPTTTYGGNSELQVGTYNAGTSKARSFITFDTVQNNNSIAGSIVSSATLKLYETWSYSCTASSITVHRAASATLSAATWDNQPNTTDNNKTSISTAKGYSSSCAAGWIQFDVTAITQGWANGNDTHPHFGLTASETSSTGWKKFSSSEGDHPPVLVVTFNHAPDTPTISFSNTSIRGEVDVIDGYWTTITGSPWVFAKTNDVDGNTSGFEIQVHSSTAGTGASLVTSCATAWVPSGDWAGCQVFGLPDNSKYYIRAEAYQTVADGPFSDWSTLGNGVRFDTAYGLPPTPTISWCSLVNGAWASTPIQPTKCTFSLDGAGGTNAPTAVHMQFDDGSVDTRPISRGSAWALT
ncbi:DNRLRE domain-containing protein, partial [Galbitalea sp. SE-J8]|uniref:DNRLRE domain-containing protein n=1 Tax=Galbitalea sp. SE-J8 TaxID=3054952 RepID=UPI00259C9EC5